MLAEHAAIFMCRNPKEPCWFVGVNSDRSLEWYMKQFEDATDEIYVGESSTDYTKAPRLGGAAAKIREFSPDARILYIMRDPIARAISHYWWEVEYSAEGRSFSEAVKASREIADVGNYAMQIAPYIKIFGRERIHVLTMEALTANPAEILGDVFEFLELDRNAAAGAALVHENRGKDTVRRVSGPFSRLKGTPLWSAAKAMMPRSIRRRAIDALAKPVDRVIPEDDFEKAIKLIRPRMLAETEALSSLLGRDFPEWRFLYDGVG